LCGDVLYKQQVSKSLNNLKWRYFMALNPIIDSRDVRYVLFEMLELEKFAKKYSKYSAFDRETFGSTLELAEKLAVEKVYPTYKESDKEGCTYLPTTREVKIPKCYHHALNAYYEAGFFSMTENPEIGGMGMPQCFATAVVEIIGSGNSNFTMYPGLSFGAMELIHAFGTKELQNIYIPKMMSGEWGGTMCLTEPDAGSEVGALKTKAIRQPDGTYKVIGQKIFISCGENDYFKNIIHPVLARIEGDPAGTKGLSLFVVPKIRVNPDQSLGEPNDLVCTGIEHKMGIKGSSTCTLSFGDNGKCIGYLLGEERKGMKEMFQMMNGARLGTAMQSQCISSMAYMHAIAYAKNRVQGKDVTQLMNPDSNYVTISRHPDVKRMLLYMKSHVEGMRIIAYYLAHMLDVAGIADGEDAREAQAMADLMLPLCKAGITDKGVEIASEAMQVLGGYGYCQDYPVEQMMRDARIFPIYEGTNGIQANTLAMRQILMNRDQYNYTILKKRIWEVINNAKGIVDDKYIALVERGVKKLDEVIAMMKDQMQKGLFPHLFMNAMPLLQTMFMLGMAWAHLWSLSITLPRMKELVREKKGEVRDKLLEENSEAAYYSGKVLSSEFYLGMEFPKYFGKIEALLFGETAVLKASDPVFTGAE
jgi:alkylation response protein AidB-like acyl-CoA dehydrogenase